MAIVEPSKGGYSGAEIPDGLYVLTCTKIEETILATDKFGKTDKFRLTLSGVTTDGEPFVVEPLLNQSWSEKANLFIYAQAFGLDPDPDEPFDTDDLIGKKAQGLVVTEDAAGAWPRVQTITRIKGKASEATKPADGSAAPRQTFWDIAHQMGHTDDDIIAVSQEYFANREPAQLTPSERTELIARLEELSVPFE